MSLDQVCIVPRRESSPTEIFYRVSVRQQLTWFEIWSLGQRFGTPLGSALAGETYDVELSLPSGDYRLRVDSFNHFVVAVRVR